eukprot:195118-Prymnesium_polylepis.1
MGHGHWHGHWNGRAVPPHNMCAEPRTTHAATTPFYLRRARARAWSEHILGDKALRVRSQQAHRRLALRVASEMPLLGQQIAHGRRLVHREEALELAGQSQRALHAAPVREAAAEIAAHHGVRHLEPFDRLPLVPQLLVDLRHRRRVPAVRVGEVVPRVDDGETPPSARAVDRVRQPQVARRVDRRAREVAHRHVDHLEPVRLLERAADAAHVDRCPQREAIRRLGEDGHARSRCRVHELRGLRDRSARRSERPWLHAVPLGALQR